jgi:L-fuconolactonase
VNAVDAHFHCWRLARADYGWLTPALAPIYRDVSIADWAREAEPLGVRGGVLVQAAPTEAETEFLLAAAAQRAEVLGVVGWADLLAPEAAQRIARLAATQPKLKGLRPMLHDLDDPDWILHPALGPALAAMAAHGLVLDALVKPLHLPRILALCQRHPNLQLVIDHGAKPDIARAQWEPWASDLAAIARQGSAVCKLSGLLTEAGARPARGAARRWADHLLDLFGPERLLWGSDWPVLELAASYRDWWDDSQAVLAPLGAAERAAVLGANARRVYRLEGTTD